MSDPMGIGTLAGNEVLDLFLDRVGSLTDPEALELGTLRSDPTFPTHHETWVPNASAFVMADVEAGQDVDLVVDAHELVAKVGPESFDIIIAVAILEHLQRPWLAVAEMAEVLRPGGVVYLDTHQTFPLHGYPNDFFRFSTDALRTLAEDAGLEVLGAGYMYPCRIEPPAEVTRWNRAPDVQAYLNVNLAAVKP
jgi:SAM-dependent methyltransferase